VHHKEHGLLMWGSWMKFKRLTANVGKVSNVNQAVTYLVVRRARKSIYADTGQAHVNLYTDAKAPGLPARLRQFT